MTASDFSLTVETLAAALGRWAARTTPVIAGEWFRLHGIDHSNKIVDLDDLFFVDERDHFRPVMGAGMHILNQEILNTGTLRNSLYPQVLNSHCQIMDLRLNLFFQGRFQIVVYQSRRGDPPVPLAEMIAVSEEMGTQVLDLGSLHLVPRGARLFWAARALADQCVILDASWEARAPAATEGRMVVMIRTYGRTRDVHTLLQRFQDQSILGDYGQMLRNTLFVIYDSSPGLTEQSYADLTLHHELNVFAMSGPNLGGGGSMSVELLTLQQAVAASGITVNELVMIDDDLSISLESLARNWGTTLFRKDNAFHTLPVLMQSDQRRMWEDGGFWGRFTPDNPRGPRTTLAPRLLRHGRCFRAGAHLDDMARLHHAEYSTFIFLSMPYVRLAQIGLPAAIFLRGDDIEYNLRHGAAGGVTVSNPNMAAWHEPAHSYAQEYMSIAHGIIINMAYGQTKPDDLAAFFHARAAAHVSLSDVAGLSVYSEVLADLVACDRLMEPNFADHYLAMIARFKSFDAAFSPVPDELVETLQGASETQGKVTVVANFLYMSAQGGEAILDRVVLWNPHTEYRYIYDPLETERLAALSTVAARLYASLGVFIQRFDNLRAHYIQRLAETSRPEFWQNEAEAASFKVLHG
jgi:hypothetical protein